MADIKAVQNTSTPITQAILQWFDQHGRKDLPWQQHNRDNRAYYVWLSEIMLQQTQVSTVIPYFLRFIEKFPNINTLAQASQDEVMQYWAGLGYYARARNLHKAANVIVDEYGGQFPDDFEQVLALPGIGRSTAGAIMAFVYQKHYAILDGNVKRVLARLYGISQYPGDKAIESKMWQLAEALTPKARVDDYTQAIMDLGATLCKRRKPDCQQCPIAAHCLAYQQDKTHLLPAKKPKKTRPVRSCDMWLITNHNSQVLLMRRPPAGIWGGLWVPPQDEQIKQVLKPLQIKPDALHWHTLTPIKHEFTHFTLHITAHTASCADFPEINADINTICDSDSLLWYHPKDKNAAGLPAPVLKLLQKTL